MVDTNATTRLLTAVDAAYARGRECLLQDSPSSLHGVIWLSAHLAALERAVETSAAGGVPEAHEQLQAQRKLSHDLQKLLRGLEQQRAGDALASHAAWPDERTILLNQLDAHAAGERELIVLLSAKLDSKTIDKIHNNYVRVFENGPTRPHPHGPHKGPLGTAAYRFATFRDHVLDVLDSRTTPIPRKPASQPPPSHWGEYFLGTSDIEGRRTEESDTD
jgi:hypothetical protein